jgi:hypothetical protein
MNSTLAHEIRREKNTSMALFVKETHEVGRKLK